MTMPDVGGGRLVQREPVDVPEGRMTESRPKEVWPTQRMARTELQTRIAVPARVCVDCLEGTGSRDGC